MAGRRENSSLTERLLVELASGQTQEQAAGSIGCSTSTIKRRLRDPEFRLRLAEVRADHMRRAVDRLVSGSVAASVVLLQITADSANPPSVRVMAARAVLDNAIRGTELLDVERRLADLQRTVDSLQGRRRSPLRLVPTDRPGRPGRGA
jgi:hypothetical protein